MAREEGVQLGGGIRGEEVGVEGVVEEVERSCSAFERLMCQRDDHVLRWSPADDG